MPELPFPDPPLTGGGVRLRPWRDADLPALVAAVRDPLIPRFTHVPDAYAEATGREYLAGREPARRAGEQLSLVIAGEADDAALLGSISLLRFAWEDARAEIGYWVAPDARGRGMATAAVRLLSRWAVRDLGLARLELRTDADNLASQAVAARAGFTREGVLRSYELRKGVRRDMVVHSLLPGD